MSKHTRLFLGIAVGFGIMLLALQLGSGNVSYARAFVTSLIGSSLFGAVIAWLSARAERRLRSKGFTTANMEPLQERQLTLPVSATESFVLCERAVHAIPKSRIVRADAMTRHIDAMVGWSWHSFGEKLSVSVAQVTARSCQVSIRSQSRFYASVDYGKGVENVETFLRALSLAVAKAENAPTKSHSDGTS